MIPVLGDVIREIGATVRQVIPDPGKQAEFELKLAELADRAEARETALLEGQIGVNREEAKHANLFVAGWRPFIGWTCGAALAWTWIGAPLVNWIASLLGAKLGAPALPPESIFPVLTGMLGLGVMRTVEKTRGVATSVGGKVLTPVKPAPGPAPAQPADPGAPPAAPRRRVPLPNWLD